MKQKFKTIEITNKNFKLNFNENKKFKIEKKIKIENENFLNNWRVVLGNNFYHNVVQLQYSQHDLELQK